MFFRVGVIILLAVICFELVHCFTPDSTITWKPCNAVTTASTSLQNIQQDSNSWTNTIMNQISTKIYGKKHILRTSTINQMVQRMMNSNLNVQNNLQSQASVAKEQCAIVKVPLLWDNSSDANSIDFFVKKFTAKKTAIGQLWLLQGGPGASGAAFDSIASHIRDELEVYDIMVPDHRGTGRSSFLKCSTGNLKSSDIVQKQKCWNNLAAKYPGTLRGWGTTNAAHDIYHVYSISRADNSTKLALFGVSYGTYWLNRFTTLYPNTASATIFDSVIPSSIDSNEQSLYSLETGNLLINVCKNIAGCNNKFISAFNQTVDKVFNDVLIQQADPKLACFQEFYTPELLTYFFAGLLTDKDLRRLILPVIYRLKRCSARDRNYLRNLNDLASTYKMELDSGLNGPADDSVAISNLIKLSELTKYPVNYTTSYWDNMFSTYPPYFNS
jgi:pimeloyl-ACP methyl ester carboxylesterase